MFVFRFVFIHVSFSIVTIRKKNAKDCAFTEGWETTIKSIYYVLFDRLWPDRTATKMSKWSNPWGPQKKNKSLRAIPGIQTCSQECVSQKKAPHGIFFFFEMRQDFIPCLPENQNQTRWSVFTDPLIASHIEQKGLENKSGSLKVDLGPPRETSPSIPTR